MFISKVSIDRCSTAVADFGRMLKMPVDPACPESLSVVEDAQLYAYMRLAEAVRAVLQAAYDENYRESYGIESETLIAALAHTCELDDDHVDALLLVFEIQELLSYDRDWLEDDEDVEAFLEAISMFPHMFKQLTRLVKKIRSEATLLEITDTEDKGH